MMDVNISVRTYSPQVGASILRHLITLPTRTVVSGFGTFAGKEWDDTVRNEGICHEEGGTHHKQGTDHGPAGDSAGAGGSARRQIALRERLRRRSRPSHANQEPI